ncbi:MAG: putative ABC transporter permease [Lachnospiraceae bacterium]|nr:putative ABC transporter permease [Lachnospiraceae bacterium]
MLLCRWLVYFVIYSFLGWVYETVVCTVKWKRWENRGFLYGPVCPIYGTGAVGSMIVTEHMAYAGVTYTWWEVFVFSMLASAVLEFTTHWVLEKLFHARWWDYSYMPLNIQGRICLPFTIAFGLAGLLIVYVINPFVYRITAWIDPFGYELMGLISMMIIGMDIALTASALAHFNVYISDAQEAWNRHMEQVVDSMEERSAQMKLRVAEEKERFSREFISARVTSMTPMAKNAVGRIVAYAHPNGNFRFGRTRILEFLKDHKPEIRMIRDRSKSDEQ